MASFQEAQNLILRKPTEAPALNRSSPYAQGLVFCTPFWEGFKHNREVVDVAGVLPDLSWGVLGDGDISWIEDQRGPLIHCVRRSSTFLTTTWTNGELTYFGDWTMLWAGTPLIYNFLSETFMSVTNGVGDWVAYQHGLSDETRLQVSPNAVGTRELILQDHQIGKYQVMIARNSAVGGLEVWRNGEFFGTDTTPLGTFTSEASTLDVDAIALFGSHLANADADHHMAAWWNHAIPDNWIPRLTSDPWAMLRSDEEPEVLRYPIWKRLPCFDLRNRRVVLKPIDQTEVRDGQIQAASAARIRRERREVDLDLTLLSENEKTALLACWDNGAGLVRPFWMQLAGETEARRYVFKTPLFSIEHRGPSAKIAKARLIDVTRFEG